MRIIAWADGASRGNPGPAAYGYVLTDEEGRELERGGEAIGRTTNNVAEYRGATAAVQAARRLGATAVELRLDSELVVLQVEGRYRVRNKRLRPLYAELMAAIEGVPEFAIRHVPREENAEADRAANAALDGVL